MQHISEIHHVAHLHAGSLLLSRTSPNTTSKNLGAFAYARTSVLIGNFLLSDCCTRSWTLLRAARLRFRIRCYQKNNFDSVYGLMQIISAYQPAQFYKVYTRKEPVVYVLETEDNMWLMTFKRCSSLLSLKATDHQIFIKISRQQIR